MTADTVDIDRRKFLAVATSATAAAGMAGMAVPFIESLQPSARALALGGPVELDVSRLEPGEMVIAMWRSKPIYVIRRTSELLDRLDAARGKLRDPDSLTPQQPDYVSNEHRAIRPEFLVLVGLCTHLGCTPVYRPEMREDWPGGFFCPCHGSKFDFAGRVWKGVPAQLNLVVPPHHYRNDTVLVIGHDTPQSA